MEKGIQLMDHQIQISNITRAKILDTPQSMRCYSFEHQQENCKNSQKCLHCADNHINKNCTNKSKSPTCPNCSGGHKPNSNKCPNRKKYLVIPKINTDPDIKIVKNPESSFKEINGSKLIQSPTVNNHPSPTTVPITKPINPNANYADCLNMTLKFNNWSKAYVEFQKSFGLEIPDSIKEDLRTEYKPNVPVPQPINQNIQKNITFKPLPLTPSEKPKPSPRTRSQKGKQNKKNNYFSFGYE